MRLDFLGAHTLFRIKLLTGSEELEEALPKLCSLGYCHYVEEILIRLGGNAGFTSLFTPFPYDVIPYACKTYTADNGDIYVVLYGKYGNEIKAYCYRLIKMESRFILTACSLDESKKYCKNQRVANNSTMPNMIASPEIAIE